MSNNGHSPTLTPELRSWIDHVIVPALVRQYLTERQPEKSLATSAGATVQSASAHAAVAEGER